MVVVIYTRGEARFTQVMRTVRDDGAREWLQTAGGKAVLEEDG
jgi:hypothetical protein